MTLTLTFSLSQAQTQIFQSKVEAVKNEYNKSNYAVAAFRVEVNLPQISSLMAEFN